MCKEAYDMETDTIAAIATAPGTAGIGVIRISGPQAIEITGRIFKNSHRESIVETMKSHTVRYGYIYDSETMIDEVLVLYMAGPKSYTREDVIEIDCHGGILATRKVFETIVRNGARPAEPGEFTKRAFLNGRIDLSQAEAVSELIQAKNEAALKNSVKQLRGSVFRKIQQVREAILRDTAYIEAALDDPEHILLEGFTEELEQRVVSDIEQIEELLQTAERGRKIKEGIRTVILGKPNAGKSSLLNLLTGEERAIVTDIAGTTRDTIEEEIQWKGITLLLMDTAGIRQTTDLVEQLGVERAKNAAKDADLILFVADSSVAFDENDKEILNLLKAGRQSGVPVIFLLNKSDLPQVLTEEEFRTQIGLPNAKIIRFSAQDEAGIQELEQTIEQCYLKEEVKFNDEVYITSIRQKQALSEAKESLSQVLKSIKEGMPEDFYSIDLMDAYEALGKITGDSVDEDLINTIFREFCMGK